MNAINEQGDTPLHLIVAYSKPITDFFTLHSIISALIERGAHTDVVNYKGGLFNNNRFFHDTCSSTAEMQYDFMPKALF